MSAEIEDFDEQLQEILNQITQILSREVGSLRGNDRLERCAYVKNRLNRSRQLLKSILVECRQLENDSRAQWEYRAKGYEIEIQKLQKELEWAQTTAERDDVHIVPMEEMTSKDYAQQGLAIQGQSLASTARTKQRIEETIQIGTQVNQELRGQTEALGKIQEDVDEIENNLSRADKQLRVFLRRMATDKMFIILILLVLIGIIVSVVLLFMKPKYSGPPPLATGTKVG